MPFIFFLVLDDGITFWCEFVYDESVIFRVFFAC